MNSTKKGYNSCIKQLREYYVTELGRRDIALPVREEDIIGFFGWLVDTKFNDKPAPPSTYVTTRAHCSGTTASTSSTSIRTLIERLSCC